MTIGVKQPWESDVYVAARLEELAKQWREQASLNQTEYGIASAVDASQIFSKAASMIMGSLQAEADHGARKQAAE